MLFNPTKESEQESIFPEGFEAEIIPATYLGYTGYQPTFAIEEKYFSDNCGYLVVPRGSSLASSTVAFPVVAYNSQYSSGGEAQVSFNNTPGVGVYTTNITTISHHSATGTYRFRISDWYPGDDSSLFPNSFVLKFKF